MRQERETLFARLRRALIRLLQSATPEPKTSESVWSVSQRDASTFLRLLSLLWLVGLAYVAFRTPYAHTANLTPWWQAAGDYTIAVLTEFGPVGVGIAIIALLITRPLNLMGELLMSLYQAMVNRYVTPVIERRRAEGRAERDAQWQEWLQRRADAESKGQPFYEALPGADTLDSE